MGWAITAACTCLAWAIWIRRWTLRPSTERLKFTERSMTLNLLLQMLGLALISPAAADTIGRAQYAITGHWNIETWVGHCLYIGAAGLISLNVAARLDLTDDELRAYFLKYFGRPMTVIMPILLALVVKSPNADPYWADFFTCPLDGWLMAYWILLCGFIAWTLALTARNLSVLRRDPRNRRTATAYLIGCWLGIIVCLTRIATVTMHTDFSTWFWTLDSACGVVFAYASGHAWRQRVRRLTSAES